MAASNDKASGGTERVHAVRFYRDVDTLSPVVAAFLANGLDNGEGAVIIATARHGAEIEKELTRRSLDVAGLRGSGALVSLDAESTLSRFMANGIPDASRFRQTIVPVLEQAAGARRSGRIRAYGEMVDILWKAGQTLAAARLEVLWSSLQGAHDFSLLCGYAMGHFYEHAAIEDICGHHSHVMAASGEASVII